MKRIYQISLLLMSLAVLAGCAKINQGADRYYVPKIIIPNWYGEEARLTTEFAALDVTPNGNDADISFTFEGKKEGYKWLNCLYSIDEFKIDFSGAGIDHDGGVITFDAETEGVISYTLANYKEIKKGSTTRMFKLSGSLDRKRPSNSTVSLTATIFDKPYTLVLGDMTRKESEAEFGQMGYPYAPDAELIHAVRYFTNETDHSVVVWLIDGLYSDDRFTVKPGETTERILLDGQGGPGTQYYLTFDDNRLSHHENKGTPYEYEGLPSEIIEKPYLTLDMGILGYDINYKCYYTITQELYDRAIPAPAD